MRPCSIRTETSVTFMNFQLSSSQPRWGIRLQLLQGPLGAGAAACEASVCSLGSSRYMIICPDMPDRPSSPILTQLMLSICVVACSNSTVRSALLLFLLLCRYILFYLHFPLFARHTLTLPLCTTACIHIISSLPPTPLTPLISIRLHSVRI